MELNKKYLIRILMSGNLLTYEGTITKVGEMFVEFVDKFGKTISVNKNIVQSFEEVGE